MSNYIQMLATTLEDVKIPEDISIDDVKGFFSKEFFMDKVVPVLLNLCKTLLIVLIVFYIGKKIIKFATKLLNRTFERSNTDLGVASFLTAVIRAILHFVLFIILISIMGFETSSLVAVVGSAGLTIGLALQGSLSNFAGGVLILLMKPFRVGDYIISGVNEGTVTGIDIFYTRLMTSDNRLIVVPNGALSNSSITNVTNEPIRRLDLTVAVDYTSNLKKAKDLLTSLALKQEMVLQEYETSVFVSSLEANKVVIGIRLWVDKENFWTLKCSILEEIKEVFDKNEIKLL